ncbi:nitroreductase [Thiofaba sp. EF100]|jgi:nitroreductase|uniref:nitroreductase family protein n=1 Tax=Thiofaba sp. EF100 TaxID=3121274 RepID=UPI0032217417
MNAAIELLLNRHSTPAKHLGAPAPEGEHLDLILRAAMSAPDHRALRPWRFLLVQGEARARLGDIFAEGYRCRHPEAEAELIERQRGKPLRSPLLILLIAHLQECAKVPEWEQMMAVGAAAEHMQLMAQALGYGSVWLSGESCGDAWVRQALGLLPHERLAGYLAMGTPTVEPLTKSRPDPWTFTEEWTG